MENSVIAERRSIRSRIAEGITIVASILVAFLIDAAWDEWNENREEQRTLAALRDEFVQNQRHLEDGIEWQTDVRAAILELLAQAALPQVQISADSTDRLLSTTSTFNSASNFELAATDAVIVGGRLSILDNESLRQRLTGWSRDIAFVINIERQDYDTFQNEWMPLLEGLSYLPQISNAFYNTPGGLPDYATRIPTRAGVDHRPLLADQRIENALVHRLWVQDDILFRYREIQPRLADMVDLLTRELGR